MEIIETKNPTQEFDFQLSEEELKEILFLLKEKESKSPIAKKLIEKFNTQSEEKIEDKPMSYKQFTPEEIIEKFSLEENLSKTNLFEKVEPQPCPERLKNTLELNKVIPLKSEKARGEMIIAPLLVELLDQYEEKFTIFSGERLKVDEEQGLTGELDYLFCNYTSKLRVLEPIFALVEAKKGDLDLGYAQCVAQMVGAREFNKQKQQEIPIIYGCVTSGKIWQFFSLENNVLTLDSKEYYLIEIDKLLGIFHYIIDSFLKNKEE